MRQAAAILTSAMLLAAPAGAEESLDELVGAMRLDEVVTILVDEGRSYAASLNTDMLDGDAGSYFFDKVDEIYAPDQMVRTMRETIREELSPEQISEAAVFFSSDLGQTIISLENSARRALKDPAVEEMAQENAKLMDREGDRFHLIEEYIEVNELVARNVEGTLSSDFSFFQGMASVQDTQSDDRALLAELFSQRDEMESETRDWLHGFLVLAYQPLTDIQMRENIAFSASETGQALNQALFVGFDRIYDRISFELGEAVGFAMQSSDL
ncbi:DUF2059 domain-containing protein [Ruegeria jejuensis]|uniref:DUF2059 domain-containing protein n=1 Tax=Ruegeria jejuensis TaxID=3233338 RepID=UPI00355B2449